MQTCPSCGAALPDDVSFCPFDGAALEAHGLGRPRRDPLVGAVIGGRYRLGSPLGSGGFAVVYLARHLSLGLDVAVKVLRGLAADDERAVARFAREARAASRIAHENVVHVFDFGRADQGFHYLVMEHVPGTPLDVELGRAAPFPAARAAHVLAQIASGIGRAHELGIVHRDLKPENVILTHRGSDRDFVKLLDFGLAKVVRSDPADPALTRVGEIFGTPYSMAPEQWLGAPTDERTDVYSMGVLGYEMLTGRRPFEGELRDLMAGHLEQTPVRPRELVADAQIPELLDTLVMTCLHKDPGDRLQGMGQVLRMLGQVWRNVPSRATRTTYSATIAAPPAPGRDAIPDPTVYQSREIDVVWDGPTLCGEITRLHELRTRRLAELAAALWTGRPPPELEELRQPIAEFEREVEAAGEEIAVAEARLEEIRTNAREREAEMRAELIDASLEIQIAADRLPRLMPGPPEAGQDRSSEPAAPAAGSPDDAAASPEDRLHRAERRLSSHLRRASAEEMEVQARLAGHIARLRDAETRLAPLYERLSRLVQRAAAKVPELRPPLLAFGKIDGALVAYQALLAMIEPG